MRALRLEIALWLRRHGIGRGRRIAVALSGGADSTALLHALAGIAQPLIAVHVHHGLRGEDADADAAFARRTCARLGVPFHGARLQPETESGLSPEAWARRGRYAALESARAKSGADWIATAHTVDDQAETVLLRAARGTGLDGLASIAALDADRRLIRPLLETPRARGRDALSSAGLPWREDASNRDLAVPRNRIRARVLPALEAAQPGASARLAALARTAGEAAAEAAADVGALLVSATEIGEGGCWMDAARLTWLGAPLRRRVWLEWLRRAGLGDQLTRNHVERIEAFASDPARPAALSLPQGCALVRDRERLWLGPAPGPRPPAGFAATPLTSDAAREFADRGLRLCFRTTAPAPARHWQVPVPKRARDGAWSVRPPRRGERIADAGNAAVPIEKWFERRAWSRAQRSRAVVVELDGAVVWMPGLATSERLRAAAPESGWLCCERLSRLWESC